MSKQKLLLADDSVTIQKVVNLTFADEGIEVISVGDGDSAMEKILETSPDLIMVDVNMPGLNGYEICEKLRNSQTFKNTPVILLVGSFEPFDEDEAKRVGADDYLTKPFQSIRQLVQKVTTLLAAERNNGFVAQEEPKAEASAVIDETPEITQSTDEKFDDTFEDYSIQTEKNDFGDVTSDDEMIQTNRLSSFNDDDIPRFESHTFHETPENTETDFDERSDEVPQLDAEKEQYSFTPIEQDAEIEGTKPYTPIEHGDEPQPYVPIEHDIEIEPKPYIPIENEAEVEEPTPYTPIEHDADIVGNETQYNGNNSTTDFDSNSVSSETFQHSTDINDVSLPEMASILTLDEQNLLEIAPREEDFIINMDYEQNASADWDLIDTPDLTDVQVPAKVEDDTKQFEIVAETPAVVEETSETEHVEADTVGFEAEKTEEIENDETAEVVQEEKSDEKNEVLVNSENNEDNEVAVETEEIAAQDSIENDSEELVKSETVEANKSVENVVSVPNFIASTVVSEVAKENLTISEELIEVIVNRVMNRLSDNVVREIAWEIVPTHTDLIVKKMVQEKLDKD